MVDDEKIRKEAFNRYTIPWEGQTYLSSEVFAFFRGAKWALQEFKKEIDWEQRRYEIAKDVYCQNPGVTEEEAIWNADALIKELKRIKVNEQ